jgi:hypothetical protein
VDVAVRDCNSRVAVMTVALRTVALPLRARAEPLAALSGRAEVLDGEVLDGAVAMSAPLVRCACAGAGQARAAVTHTPMQARVK